MRAVDTNILVYAHRREGPESEPAHELMMSLASGDTTWAVPWPCVYEFLSVVTNRRIWNDAASSPAQAWQQLRAWIDSPTCRLLHETPGFEDTLQEFLLRPRVIGPIVHDARIAALCLAHGCEALFSRDRDFSLFPELVLSNPFA